MSHLKPDVSDRDHRSGPEDAPVTLVEYGDYECPSCGMAFPIVHRVRRDLGSRLRFVFRNFPLTEVHPHARHAAELAEAAGAQGRFWEMHDELFEHQSALDDRHLLQYAKTLALDVERVTRELETGTHLDRIQSDIASGIHSGVNGTPTFFVNGQRLDGAWGYPDLMAAIDLAGAARKK